MDTVTVKAAAESNTVKTSSDGSVNMNLKIMEMLPKMMGNADPITYSKLLPGVQSTGEYSGSLHINGSENSHNMISVLDVPLYNVNHLFGFFSAFIPTHYSSMSLQRTPQMAGSPNRLGGELKFRPYTEREGDRASGDITVGLLSSQGTVKVPMGKKSLLTASLRSAYINLLYSKWMELENSTLHYSFFDSNLTWTCNLNDYNVIMADAYWGRDNSAFFENSFITDAKSSWGNDAESVHWIHTGKKGLNVKQTLYRSNSFAHLHMIHDGGNLKAPSSITDLGYKGSLEWKGLTLGAESMYHDFVLQSPVIDDSYIVTATETPRSDAWEHSVYSDYSFFLLDRLNVRLGLRGDMFVCQGKRYTSADPSFLATYYSRDNDWSLSLSLSQRHQFLFQTGITGLGLPSEFWMPAHGDFKPQYMRGVTMSGMVEIGSGLTLNSSVYYKKLYNQLEFFGSIMDLLVGVYDLSKNVQQGDGRAFGFNAMLHKRTGKLTGWISYALSRSLRTFNNPYYQGEYPSNHERIHELDVVATYDFGKWDLGGTLIAASGTPYTRPESFSVLGDRIFCFYGEHNGARLPAYIRLDLSANWYFHKDARRKSGLNFSLYNVLMRSNAIAYGLVRDYDSTTFSFRPMDFGIRMLPSIAYFYSF